MNNSVVLVGVVSNVSTIIQSEIDAILSALSNASVQINKVFLVESDSEDSTISVLEEIKKKIHFFNYISLGNLSKTFPHRTERLAVCRNRYMSELESQNFYGASYIYVSDLDGVNSSLDHVSIKAAFNFLNSTPGSAATSNQKYKYYDIWALRHALLCPNDCWLMYHLYKDIIGKENAHYFANLSKMISFNKEQKPFEVDSAFGGGAIYDVKYVWGCRYVGMNGKNPVCEHVAFSMTYKENGGSIYIVPGFINHDKSIHVLNAENFEIFLDSSSVVDFDL